MGGDEGGGPLEAGMETIDGAGGGFGGWRQRRRQIHGGARVLEGGDDRGALTLEGRLAGTGKRLKGAGRRSRGVTGRSQGVTVRRAKEPSYWGGKGCYFSRRH